MNKGSIEIKNLYKTFGTQTVLNGLNLSIPAGKTTVILGKSGEGKSVLLKHIIALLRPDSGQILIDGENIFEMNMEKLRSVRKEMGMVFQDAALFDSMTVFDNVAFPLYEHTNMMDSEIEEKVLAKLDMVGLKDAALKTPDELSGGMRKRVGLARALVMDPKIILYDEPTTGLDPIIGHQITDLILNAQQKLGITGVVISHNLSTSFRIADKMALLSRGRIVFEGSTDDFKKTDDPIVTDFLRKGMVPLYDKGRMK